MAPTASADPQPEPPIRRRRTARTRSSTSIPLWATAALSAVSLLAGVGIGDAVTSTPTPWAPMPPVTTPLPGTPTGPPITPMNLGDTLLLGTTTGIAFTVTQAADPAVAENSIPSPGYRYLAVRLTITNTTSSAWQSNGVPTVRSVIISGDGKQYRADAHASTALAPPFTANLVLPAGGTATGAVTFQAPATVAITSVRIALTPDAGAVGLWTIS